MIRTRWRKVLRDLLGHKTRTLLVIMAIAVGVFAVGLIASGQVLLLREIRRDYAVSNVSSAILYTSPFDQALVERVADMPQVAAATGRHTINVRAQVGPQAWRDLTLTVIPDYNDIEIDKIKPDGGQWNPEKGEILIERLSFDYLNTAVSDAILVERASGEQRRLRVIGQTHDSNVPDAAILDRAFAYIDQDTAEWLGDGRTFTELRFRVAGDVGDREHVEAVAAAVEDQVEKSGHTVFRSRIPPPGEHWAEDIIETMVLLFTVFSVLILFLSGFLVINTISALLAQHVKQIGVMKLVGARRPQIMGMYFVTVLTYGVAALIIGMPLGIFSAQYLVKNFVAGLLNFNVSDLSVPWSVIALQAAVGLLVPLLAALWPVISGARVTTHKALNSLGIGGGSYGQGLIDRLFVRLQEVAPVQRPLIISIRNTVRRKARLLLTLATLIMGTALFIGVLSVRDSVSLTLDNFLRFHQYDVAVAFSRPYRQARLERLAGQVAGVTAVESWFTGGARRMRPDGSESDAYSLVAAPAETTFMDPPLLQGRPLQPNDRDGVIVNTDFLDEEPDLAVGDTVRLNLDGREANWRIAGVTRGTAEGPILYLGRDAYTYFTRQSAQANSLRIKADRHDAAYQDALRTTLINHFQENGLRVDGDFTSQSLRDRLNYRFNIVFGFLVLMAVLLAAVGGLGLTTTMSINVLERIREIGVMRAIGASDNAIRLIVLAEGIFIGWLSFAVGLVLALPLGRLLSRQVGVALLGSPLNFTFSWQGALIWLVLVSLLGAAASLGPARNASKLTIREVLAYE